MSNKWFPTKKEIEKWIDQKLHQFVAQENRNAHLSKEEWLNRYLYTEDHEIFFFSFPCELHQWLYKLQDIEGTWKLDNPIVWTLELVRHLEDSENNIVRAVDYWIGSILGSFITEFAIDTSVIYSKEK